MMIIAFGIVFMFIGAGIVIGLMREMLAIEDGKQKCSSLLRWVIPFISYLAAFSAGLCVLV